MVITTVRHDSPVIKKPAPTGDHRRGRAKSPALPPRLAAWTSIRGSLPPRACSQAYPLVAAITGGPDTAYSCSAGRSRADSLAFPHRFPPASSDARRLFGASVQAVGGRIRLSEERSTGYWSPSSRFQCFRAAVRECPTAAPYLLFMISPIHGKSIPRLASQEFRICVLGWHDMACRCNGGA